MRKLFIACCIILSCLSLHAQQENIWIFGNNAALDFNGGSLVAFSTGMPFTIDEGCANVCDNNGQLLFVTDGYKVVDRNYNIMPNGNGLITDIPMPLNMMSSSSQGALIIPVPDNPHKYYIFSLTPNELNQNMGRLYYSVVNMSSNGGLGDVEPGQKGILLDSFLTEHMSGVVGDHCNVWVVVASRLIPQFKSFEINSAGINTTPVLSNFSGPVPTEPGRIGISPSRKKLSIGNANDLELYDFSPASGILSNQIILDNFIGSYGVCFSPNSSKLYATAGLTSVVQYDLSSGAAASIIASKNILVPSTQLTDIKLGPDGKVYWMQTNSTMGRVNMPDLYGAACIPNLNAVTLPSNALMIGGLPNVVPVIKRDTIHNSQRSQPPCFTDNITLVATNDTTGWGYIWNHGILGREATITGSGTYWVSYHEPPCTYHVDTFHVIVESHIPSIKSIAGCKNDTNARAWATTAATDTITYTYTWRIDSQIVQGPLQSNHGDTLSNIFNGTTYTLEIHAPNGCDTILKITTPFPDYQAAFTVSDTVICMGTSVSFLNTSQGGFNSYQWTFGDGEVSVLENPQHTYLHAGTYLVQQHAQTSVPCYDTSYATIVVDALMTGKFHASPDKICRGQAIVFTPQTDSTTLSLHWQLGDGNTLTTPNEIIQHAYDIDGEVLVTLETHFRACPNAFSSQTIHAYPLPLVDLGADTGLCFNGAPILIQNLQPPPEGTYQSLWNTGDTTDNLKVVHPGTFSLTVSTAPLGCSTTETIEVHKDCYINIPNVFSPNGDGINDYFFPRQLLSRKVTQFRMQLFNRWGQIIFETLNTDGRGWDGKFNNKDQPQGVYMYLIEAELDGMYKNHYQGNVTLIR